MQTASLAATPTAATPIGPASTSRLSNTIAEAIPRAVLDAPIGDGTVGTNLDRSIRIRLGGSNPASKRELIAETYAAADLLQGPKGAAFERGIRAIASVADGWNGAENLKTITLYPDEFSSMAGKVVDRLDVARAGGENLSAYRDTGRATALVKKLVDPEPAGLRFRAARNFEGHISIAPDVSRDLLATLGLYTPRPGDESSDMRPEYVPTALGEAWRTAVHETHHSVTPVRMSREDEWVSVFEEAVPTVLERLQGDPIMQRAGANIDDTAARILKRDETNVRDTVDWQPWNRDHLPPPPAAKVATAEGRYTDGPKLVEDIIKLAGIDASQPKMVDTVAHLLQAKSAEHVPERLATLLVLSREGDRGDIPELTQLIKDASVGDASFEDVKRLVEVG